MTMASTEQQSLESRLTEAQRRAEFLNDLLCHDIRNLDQTIVGYLDLVLNRKLGEVSDRHRRVLSVCRRQAQRMRDLIERVCVLARLEPGCTLDVAPVALEPLVREAARVVREAYHDRGAEVTCEVPPDCAVLAGPLLGDVLVNLIANGIAHNVSEPPWVRVTVEAARPDRPAVWRIRVEDNGPGIEDQRKAEVFERFARMSTRGSGVGLSLVRGLVQAYGGRVWVEDRVAEHPEEGARFIAELRAPT
jgi:signal transduction histidine kinase